MASALEEASIRVKTYMLAVESGDYDIALSLPIMDPFILSKWATNDGGGFVATEKLLKVNQFCLKTCGVVETTAQRRFIAVLWINVLGTLGMKWHLAALKESYDSFMDCDDDDMCCTTMEGTDYGALISFRKGIAYMEVAWLRFVEGMLLISRKILGSKYYEFSGQCHQHPDRSEPGSSSSFRMGRMWQRGRVREQLFHDFRPVPLTDASRQCMYDDGELFSNSAASMEEKRLPAFGVLTSGSDYGALCAAGRCEFHAGVDERRQLMLRAEHGENAEWMSIDYDPKMTKWLTYRRTCYDWCTRRRKRHSYKGCT